MDIQQVSTVQHRELYLIACCCCYSVARWSPGTGEPGGLPSMGSHRVGHDWRDLAAAAAAGGLRLFVTPWTAACQASLSFLIPQSLLTLRSIELVMPSNHLTLCCPLLLLPSIFPSIRAFFSIMEKNRKKNPCLYTYIKYRGFLGGSDSKESVCNADLILGLIPR